MENLPNSSIPSLTEKTPLFKSKIPWLLVGLALIGLFDASFLTFSHYAGLPIPCGPIGGCDVVTTSEYSFFFGVPLALWGVLYYGLLLVLSLIYLDKGKVSVIGAIAGITALGLAASLYFVYLQAMVIGAFCLWCLASAVVTTVLFITSAIFYKIYQKNF